jgi:2-polyprenyl-3-methyl-5-hydroxy-6-metoxy-1,4-benzoquinol methylase
VERIMATSMADIRPDHMARYVAAKHWLTTNGATGHVLDAGCGVGYGSTLMSDAIRSITCVDASAEAAALHAQHFAKPNVNYIKANLFDAPLQGPFDAVVSFEFLEHIHEARQAVELFGTLAPVLICSTPNEEVRPHKMEPVNPFHVRHYTPEEFEDLLAAGGFKVTARFHQRGGQDPKLRPGWDGKFMIAVAVKPKG